MELAPLMEQGRELGVYGNVSLAVTVVDLVSQELGKRNAFNLDEIKGILDASWVFGSAILVILMQLGFAMLEHGAVREQNAIATYAKNIIDFLLGILAAVFCGYNFAFPDKETHVMEMTSAPEFHAMRTSWFFHVAFQSAATTIVSGAMAERTTLGAYVGYAFFMSAFIYPLAVRYSWGGGILAELDPPYHDFAGSGVVHLTGGAAALTGACLVGSRIGRWDPIIEENFAPHNVPSMLTGVLLLWVGWYGFNPGSTFALSDLETASVASNAFVTTTFAASTGGGVIMFASLIYRRFQSVDVLGTANGILGGLVAITAGCDAIDPDFSTIVGLVGGLVYLLAVKFRKWLKIDDVLDAFAVHGACGAWGVLAVGLFHRDQGCLVGQGHSTALLKSQAIGIGLLAASSIGPTLFFMGALKCLRLLRCSADEENEGLDVKLGVSAYSRQNQGLDEVRSAASFLRKFEMTPQEAVEALDHLRQLILRPFTPQAADNKLMGEVQDIIDHVGLDGQPGGSDSWSKGSVKYLSFLAFDKQDGSEVARVFVDTVRRVMQSHPERMGQWKEAPDHWVYLDEEDTKSGKHELEKDIGYVSGSDNFILLMTRSVLKRPWVLAELTKAHKMGKNTVCVLVEWPDKDSDLRAFRFPQDLNSAVNQWREYVDGLPTENKKGSLSRMITPDRKNSSDGNENPASNSSQRSPSKDNSDTSNSQPIAGLPQFYGVDEAALESNTVFL